MTTWCQSLCLNGLLYRTYRAASTSISFAVGIAYRIAILWATGSVSGVYRTVSFFKFGKDAAVGISNLHLCNASISCQKLLICGIGMYLLSCFGTILTAKTAMEHAYISIITMEWDMREDDISGSGGNKAQKE